MTPRLLAAFFQGKANAGIERKRLAAWVAWHAGAIAAADKIPPLDDLMPTDTRRRRKQTPAEQFAIALRWNAQLGGKVEPLERPV